MSDRYCGDIMIGGRIPRSLIPGLIKAINEHGCSAQWGGGPDIKIDQSDPKAAEKVLLSLLQDDDGDMPNYKGRLWLCDEQAPYGELRSIEDYCVEHGIAFRRFSEAYCDYPAEVSEFRPGMKAAVSYTCGRSLTPLVDGDEVKKLLDLLGTHSTDAPEVRAQIEKLRQELPPELPEVQPFEIVKG